MPLAIILILLVIGSVLFHLLSPWQATPAASNWGSIDQTLLITAVITGLFFVAISLFVAIALIRFRHRSGQKAAYQPENRRLESWLIGITTVGIVAMLAPGLVVYDDFVRVPDDAMPVEVVGQQWQWAYRFPGDDGKLGRSGIGWVSPENPLGLDPEDADGRDDRVVRASELHLPLGRPVKVLLRSKDVLHNFYVPQIRSKMDMVPGMVTYFWFEPTVAGNFEILCAEFCGVGHYNMRGKLVIEPEEAFAAWLEGQPTFAQLLAGTAQPAAESTVAHGRRLAENNGCLACHTLDGSRGLAPGWKGLYGKTEILTDGSEVEVDDAYLKESITDPKAKMVQGYPPVMVAYPFNDAELDALVAFIRSLDADDGGAGLVEQGRELAAGMGCLACHSVDGSTTPGPGWQGLYGKEEELADGSTVRVDDAYLAESIREPNAKMVKGFAPIMPPYNLKEGEVAALIAYIRSLAEPDQHKGTAP